MKTSRFSDQLKLQNLPGKLRQRAKCSFDFPIWNRTHRYTFRISSRNVISWSMCATFTCQLSTAPQCIWNIAFSHLLTLLKHFIAHLWEVSICLQKNTIRVSEPSC